MRVGGKEASSGSPVVVVRCCLPSATAAQIYKRGVRYFSASPLVDANFYECQFAADAEP